MPRQTFDWPPTDDQFDLREVLARFEQIEDSDDADDITERADIQTFLDAIKGYGGDEQWRGDWYPNTFIADGYFERYAQDLADDIGAIKSDTQWPYTCIDWEQAASELQTDYSSVDIHGTTYWYR